jgi:hypothetical protein
MENPNYPQACFECREPLPEGGHWRPRKTCGDVCRQRRSRRRRADRKRSDKEWEAKTRAAIRQLRKWQRAGLDLNYRPPDQPGAQPLGNRLLMYLQRDWPIRTCARCALPFMRDFVATEFCSEKCRKEDLEARKAVEAWMSDPAKAALLNPAVHARIALKLPLKVCKECTKPFPLHNKQRETCSDACRARHHRKWWRVCKRCGEKFKRKRLAGSAELFCSDPCRQSMRNEKRLARHHAKHLKDYSERPCLRCDTAFAPKWGHPHQKYCGEACMNRANIARKAERKRAATRARREESAWQPWW